MGKANTVQELWVKCFAIHKLKMKSWKNMWNETNNIGCLVFKGKRLKTMHLLFFLSLFMLFCKLSNYIYAFYARLLDWVCFNFSFDKRILITRVDFLDCFDCKLVFKPTFNWNPHATLIKTYQGFQIRRLNSGNCCGVSNIDNLRSHIDSSESLNFVDICEWLIA